MEGQGKSRVESVRMEVDVRSTDRPPRVRQPVDESRPEDGRTWPNIAEATNPRPSAQRCPTTSSRTANATLCASYSRYFGTFRSFQQIEPRCV